MDVAIVGGGNLGCALAKAIAKRYDVVVTRRNVDKIRFLEDLGCELCSDNVNAVSKAKLVFVTVKPKDVFQVLSELRDVLEDKILVSFVAGVRIDDLKRVVDCKIVRAMTSLSAELGCSVTAYYTEDLSPDEVFELEMVFDCMGDVVRVEDESLLDAITAYSSAVAFMAKIFESFVYAGLKLGLNRDLARKLTEGLFKGSSELLSLEEPEEVIGRVVTPAGTTIEGIIKMMEHGVDFGIVDAMLSSAKPCRR